jgi:hypothetical protein
MENKFKYRPEIKSIEDLQPGDEFLVGDERWEVMDNRKDLRMPITASDNKWWNVTEDLIRANVPIERDIPYPEGGAEKWELREGDDDWVKPQGTLCWMNSRSRRGDVEWLASSQSGCIYAIPKAKPQDKAKPAPKEYEVKLVSGFGQKWLNMGTEPCDSDGRPLKPGDRVTVQRVSEQGEPR